VEINYALALATELVYIQTPGNLELGKVEQSIWKKTHYRTLVILCMRAGST
jgi:hypothetical protein